MGVHAFIKSQDSCAHVRYPFFQSMCLSIPNSPIAITFVLSKMGRLREDVDCSSEKSKYDDLRDLRHLPIDEGH